MASGGSGGGGNGGVSTPESLNSARLVGDTFSGDVYWDNGSEAIFGKASSEANQDYLRIYSDKTNHLQVFDSTKDGTGTVRRMSWQMGGAEEMALYPNGGLVLGSATGGSQGGGTINISGDYYINGVPLTSVANAWTKSGNSFGVDGILGTLDAFDLLLYSGNAVAATITHGNQNMLLGDASAYGPNGGAANSIFQARRDAADTIVLALWNNFSGPPGNLADARIAVGADLAAGGITGHFLALDCFNSNYASHAGAANADSAAVWAYNMPLSIGTHDTHQLRFVVSQTYEGELTAAGNWMLGPTAVTYDDPFGRSLVNMARDLDDVVWCQLINNATGNAIASNVVFSHGGAVVWTGSAGSGYSTNTAGISSYVAAGDVFIDAAGTGLNRFIIASDKEIHVVSNGNDVVEKFTAAHELVQAAPAAVPADGTLFNGSVSISIDEAGNTLKIKAKYSGGTVKNLTTPLALS